MKTLHLLRHAKSAWDQEGLPDRERRLNRRGERDAPLMGTALSGMIEPMPIHVSPARRAQLTLSHLCAAWPALASIEHRVEEGLYTFSGEALVEWISAREDAQNSLFIIAHNPALTDLINTLTRVFSLANLPTAGYVQLSLDIDRWRHLLHCVAVLEHSLFPKQLK